MSLRSQLIRQTYLSSMALRVRPVSTSVLQLSKTITPTGSGKDETKPDRTTHTGQRFEQDDYRLSRFVNKTKEFNRKFAADLIGEVKPASIPSRIVSCDGGGGPTGHPKVYINLDGPGNHTCGYCGLRFYKRYQPHH